MGCNCGKKADTASYTVTTKTGAVYSGVSAGAARLLIAKNPGATKTVEPKK